MDLTREPLRLTTELTVVEHDVDGLVLTPLRLVHEDDEFATTPLRLLGEARPRGQSPQGQAQPPASGGNWVRRGLAGAAAGGLAGGIPGAVAGGAIGALSATNHPANFVSGWKGAKSGKGTLAHHIGQFLSPHQRALRNLQKQSELQKAYAGVHTAGTEHQKAMRAHVKAQQQAKVQQAKGTTTASPGPGGPAGGAPSSASSAPVPLPIVQHTPPAPPPAGGAPPPAPPAPPTPPAGGTPPAAPPVPPPAPPPSAAGSPAPGATPSSSKDVETHAAKLQTAHDELRNHIKNNKGAGRVGAHAILNKHYPGGFEPHEIDDIYSKLHRAEHGNEEPPEHEMKTPLGGAPATPAAEPKPAEPEKPEKGGGLDAARAAVHQHIKGGGDIAGTHKIMAQHGVKDPGLAKQVHAQQVKHVAKGLDHTGSKPKPPAAPTPPAPKAPAPAVPAAAPAPKPAAGPTPPKAPNVTKPTAAPAITSPAVAPETKGPESPPKRGPGRPRTRPNSHASKGGKCHPGETQVSGGHGNDKEGGPPQCQKTPGAEKPEGRPSGAAPVSSKEDIADLIGDLNLLTDRL